jgi:preprotein translocase SecE subunit
MATAVEPNSESRTPTSPASLPVASLLGAIYVVAAIAVVFYAVPAFWREMIAPRLGGNTFVDALGRLVVQAIVGVVLVIFGRRLLGDSAPKGIHGGIFLMISAAITIFFLWRAVALNFDGPAGLIVSGVFAAFMLYVAVRYFSGKSAERRMIGLEEQGWMSGASYKRSLGLRARRLTILGILLIGGSGVYSLWTQGTLPENLTLSMPFENMTQITILPDAKVTVPLLLMSFSLWFAWRAVNVPSFAEFLIATEAEMNKVSWTPKKRLGQDTVVVLTTLLLMTLFLLVVDVFWGWLLSRSVIGVLPARATNTNSGQPQQAKW